MASQSVAASKTPGGFIGSTGVHMVATFSILDTSDSEYIYIIVLTSNIS
jgi:hypothetical protein